MAKSRTRAPSRSRRKAAPSESEVLARRIALLVAEKRAEDVVVLDVRGLADYMDFLVIASGTAERQVRAIADHVVRSLRGEKVRPLSASGADGGTWVCVDFVDVVLHVFERATRIHYDLEMVWGDAPRLELAAPAPAPASP
jgi:ribosome-associated protein